MERLQKVMAAAGVGSRRACEEWIEVGRVTVNGKTVTELGTKVNPLTDKIAFDGRLVRQPAKRYYLAVNKPRGYVCTRSDPHAARLVTELVDLASKPMLRPVGRLDADSEGLIFLTDDGDFLNRMTHPRHHVPKTYRAQVKGVPSPESLQILARGVRLEDGLTAPAQHVFLRGKRPAPAEVNADTQTEVEITISEGRKRQVRRMLAAVGHPVVKLTRISVGSVRVSGLPSGGWRHLTPAEVSALIAASQPEQKSQPQQKQENTPLWQTASSRSRPPKAPSSPASLRTTRPAPSPISSALPKKDSTTA